MGKLSWQNWRNKMEQLIKEQGSRLELLEATVKEQKAQLDKLESSPLHPPGQPNSISEIRDALVRVLRVPRKVPERKSAPGNKEVHDPPCADSHQKTTAPEGVTNPERTGTAQVLGKGYPEVRVQPDRTGIHKKAAECVSKSEHEGLTITFLTSSRQGKDATTEELTIPKRINIPSTEKLRAETSKTDTTQTVHVPRAGSGNPKSAVKRSFKVDHRRSTKSKNSDNKIKSSSTGERNALVDLDSGLKTKENLEGSRFKCTYCAKPFLCKSRLNEHMRVHNGEKPFSCKVCRKQFTQSGNLKRHIKTHTQEKPFVCEFCRKAFSQGSSLTAHRRIHTGEAPFVCEECGASFRWRKQLIGHKNMHAPGSLYILSLP